LDELIRIKHPYKIKEVLIMRFKMYCLMIVMAVAVAANGADEISKADISVPADCQNVKFRGSLENSRIVFERTGKGHVAFMGGSITEMDGYRPMVCEILKKRFPKTNFKFTNAGIASTCSTTGAFRLEEQVLSQGPVDLFFVEFSVNDDQDAHHSRRECIRGLEGIIRHVLAHNPNADIVVTSFVNEAMLKDFAAGKETVSSASHEEVAQHYQIPRIALNREVSERIQEGKLTWKQFGGVHPGPTGNQLCANMIDRLLDQSWKGALPKGAVMKPHLLPGAMDEYSYAKGHFVDFAKVKIVSGWKLEKPEWSKLPGSHRPRWDNDILLCATEPGAELELKFQGTAVGIYLLAGPDAGILDAKIDNDPVKSFDLLHGYSADLHYPRSIIFNVDLTQGQHVLTLKLSNSKNDKSKGTAARILKFCVN
jgi:lysophospholipase L1-like esterase